MLFYGCSHYHNKDIEDNCIYSHSLRLLGLLCCPKPAAVFMFVFQNVPQNIITLSEIKVWL